MSIPIHISLRITGRVQGVFYRASARDEAVRLGVSGFVRNEPDGSVYAEAEGDPDSLERFEDWCRRGPPRARVEGIEKRIGPLRGYAGFKVA